MSIAFKLNGNASVSCFRFSCILLTYLQRCVHKQGLVSYRWIIDNMVVLALTASLKTTAHRWSPQHTCLAVSQQLNLLADVWIMESVYLPDCLMGNIDSISGKDTHESASESMESGSPR